MERISLLDCTLRDGGYINDWRFGKDAIWDMADKLEQTGVEILELGFIKNEPYQEDRTVFNSMEQVKKLIGKKRLGTQYAVMAEVLSPIPVEMIDPADTEGPDIVRVIVWKTKHDENGNVVDALQEGYEYCKGIREKGYKLCVQPARVDQYNDEEFVAMVHLFEKLDPMAIYVVDSWGTQNPESLLHYMHLADDNMKEGICLGYHGHNNMMQALAVAQAMLKEDFDRELIIDASVYGIGRGAGNLNSEIFAKYLNEQYGKHYYLDPMIEVYAKYIKDIFQQEAWGYSVPYYLTARYNCNPNYGSYYATKLALSEAQIQHILSKMDSEERVLYSAAKAEKLAKKYKQMNYLLNESPKEIRNMKQYANIHRISYSSSSAVTKSALRCYRYHFWGKKLCIIVPTANRPDSIQYYLEITGKLFANFGITLVIYDSSKDNRTKELVQKYQEDGANTVIYDYWDGQFDGVALCQKVIDAYTKYSQKYEYVWMCRDGLIINLIPIYQQLYAILEPSEYDLVTVYSNFEDYLKIGSREYDDSVSFFKDHACHMTILGSTIVKSSFIKSVLENCPLSEANYGMWQPIAFFKTLAHSSSKMFSIVNEPFIGNPAGSTSSFWNRNGRALWQWGERWYKMITGLPSLYDDEKSGVLQVEMADFHPFAVKELFIMRGNGSLSLKLIKKYKKYLPYVGKTPMWKYYVIACFPKSLVKLVYMHPDSLFGRLPRKVYFALQRVVRRIRDKN